MIRNGMIVHSASAHRGEPPAKVLPRQDHQGRIAGKDQEPEPGARSLTPSPRAGEMKQVGATNATVPALVLVCLLVNHGDMQAVLRFQSLRISKPVPSRSWERTLGVIRK